LISQGVPQLGGVNGEMAKTNLHTYTAVAARGLTWR